MRRITLGLAAISLALCGCPHTEYLDAAGKFASATSTSSATLAGAVSLNHQLCRRRAELDYLQHRIEGSNYIDNKFVYWVDFYHTFKLAGGPTWKDQCKTMELGDAAMSNALSALNAYASALGVVAGNDFSGTDIGQLVTDSGTLVAAVPAVPGKVGPVVKSLGATSTSPGPIGQLAGVLKRTYAAGKVADIVKDSDASVKELLAVISGYVKAVGEEQSQWSEETAQIVDEFDALLPERAVPPPATSAPPAPPAPPPKAPPPAALKTPEPASEVTKGKARAVAAVPAVPAAAAQTDATPKRPNPTDLIDLYRFAEEWKREVAKTRTQQKALADACQKLDQAEQALVQANGSNSAPSLGTVLTLVGELLSDVAAVQSALQGGGK
jgi:hypothetical protein